MIKLNTVSKIFSNNTNKTVRALSDVNLDICKGDFVVVMGASGSGKSTLLYTIGGLQEPDQGTITINDQDMYQLTVSQRATLRRQKLGFIFQTFNLIPYLNCLENVALPSILGGMSKKEALDLSLGYLTKLGLENRVKHLTNELSIGEQQRVAIARSLCNNPEIILADEPTGNMDPKRTNEIMTILHEINQEGTTILMVTHNQSYSHLGSRLIMLDEGVLIEQSQVPLGSF